MSIPSLQHTQWGEHFVLYPRFSQYPSGATAVQLVTGNGEPFCKLTTNIVGISETLPEGQVCIKNWSENEEIVKTAIEAGWLTLTGREVVSGHVAPEVMTVSGDLGKAYYEHLGS